MRIQSTCDIVQLRNENSMEMLTKYIIPVDSAIPLSEKHCFLTFSITGCSVAMAQHEHTHTLRTKFNCKANRLLNVGFHFQNENEKLIIVKWKLNKRTEKQ